MKDFSVKNRVMLQESFTAKVKQEVTRPIFLVIFYKMGHQTDILVIEQHLV